MTTKVILFSVRTSAKILDNEDPDRDWLLDREDIRFANGMLMELAAGVYEETVTKVGTVEKYEYRLIPSTIPSAFYDRRQLHAGTAYARERYRIPWTSDWEKFFASMGSTLIDALLKLVALEKNFGLVEVPADDDAA